MITEFKGEYRWLSNFFPVKVEYNEITFPSVEHAYQAAKSLDPKDWELIAKMPKASEAKRYGNALKLRPDWEVEKDSIMLNLLYQKFLSNKEFELKLLSTGEQVIIEGNTWGDTYWGMCNGEGKNVLGEMIMKVRTILKELIEIKKNLANPMSNE